MRAEEGDDRWLAERARRLQRAEGRVLDAEERADAVNQAPATDVSGKVQNYTGPDGSRGTAAPGYGGKLVDTQTGDWDRAKAQSLTENWIQSGKLKAGMIVCANNDEMALGAINALKAANLLDKVFVGGVDATSEALAAMQAGDLEVTVFQDAKGQGAGGVQAAVDLVNGKTVPDYVDIPYVLVTPANINDYLGAN